MHPNRDGLTPNQLEVFLEVVDASLRITRRDQYFSWLQGCFQYLLPHEVLLCGIRDDSSQLLGFESFSTTRYFKQAHLDLVTAKPDGLLSRAIASWHQLRRPLLLAQGLPAGDFGTYVVPFSGQDDVLQDVELRNIVAHGLGGRDGGVSTFFCFSRIPGEPGANHAYILELLVPYLHAALKRVMSKGGADVAQMRQEADSQITERECEILEWVQRGKTNWEIASILDISPLTVKNHIQKIFRKLAVNNRSNAATKASRLGLIKP